MYTTIKNIILISLFTVFFGCQEPAPIEIINEEDAVEISVINPEPKAYVVTGYDSTGITDETPKLSSIVSYSGIKNTFEKLTTYKAYAQAVFYDTTKPVLNANNRLLGFQTFDVETVSFNSRVANKVPHYIRFSENFVRKDSLIGTKHALTWNRVLSPDNLDFRYNSNLKVDITSMLGNTNSLNLRIPDEIIGKVSISGSRESDKFKIILTWGKSIIGSHLSSGSFAEEIVIGGIRNGRDELVPLLKLNRLQSNRFEIPHSLLEDILASSDYNYIVFTFIRKILISNSYNRLGDIYFVSQSIHNIWVKL